VFEGFTLEYVDVGEVTLRVRHGGDGQSVVLLHGHPRTHAAWAPDSTAAGRLVLRRLPRSAR
jgi:pimeloyl-ACP methyl ester carboxylesterase